MTYLQRLKERIYAFIFYLLVQAVMFDVIHIFKLLIFNKPSHQKSDLYLLFAQSDLTSIFTSLITALFIIGAGAFISPFIERFLRKHGYLPRKI